MERLQKPGERKQAPAADGGTAKDRSSPRRGSPRHRVQTTDDSFISELRPPSTASIPTGSWESGEAGDSSRIPRGASRADRRKIFDTTTPTLIDEHDVSEDEEEMVSLARERMRREMMGEASAMAPPGMGEEAGSMRRTPGAIAMQTSSRHTSVSTTEVTDAALLGFGLTLTTPVVAPSKGATGQQLSADSFSSSSSSSQVGAVTTQKDDAPGCPLAVNTNLRSHDPRDRSYTPAGWTLSKNPHLEVSHGAFSPNTLRLTEDLDNLLLDDEDTSGDKPKQHVFRDPLKGSFSIQESVSAIEEADEEPVESWTAPYIFGQDGGQAEKMKAKGRYRKGKIEGGRRSRGGGETPKTARTESSDIARHAHPKPLRQGQVTKIDSGFTASSGFGAARNHSPNFNYQGRVDDDEGRQPLNFGGAFVPPTKGGNFRRPVPSTLRSSSTHDQSAVAAPSSGSSQGYGGGSRPTVSPFQSMNQPQYTPQFSVGSGSMRYLSQPPPQSAYGSTTPPLTYGMGGFGSSAAGHGHSIGFLGGMNPYAAPMGQQMGHGNMPMGGGQHHAAPPRQQWSQQQMMPPMNYNSGMTHRDSGWQGGNVSGGWGNARSGFGYGVPPPGMMDSRIHLTPSPQFAPGWQDHGYSGTEGGMQYPSQQMNSQGGGASSQAFSGYSGTSGTHGNEGRGSRGAKQSQAKGEGSRKQRNADKKKSGGLKEKSKGTEADRKKRPGSPRKKKQTKNRGSSPTKTSAAYSRKDIQGTEGLTSFSEDLDPKRNEIDEDPEARAAFKDFYRQFRDKERRSFKEGEEFARKTLEEDTLPENVRWRVYLELADLAKRSNRIVEARELYKQVCELQPYASQGWLEYSKLEEECGHLNRCARILKNGLEYCEYSESLLTRAIKHSEKMGNLDTARQLLARLKHVGIEKVWRSVLEGALLEARAGNTLMARRVLKYLMHHVPWYGPLYLEAYRVERDQGRLNEALAIVEKGLRSIPRYGPLWFGAFRLCEALDMSEKAYHLPRTKALLRRATNNISRELVWKIHLDAAQIFERTANLLCEENEELVLNNELNVCRKRYAMTAATCPPNLSWKVWLASGRMELSAGNSDRARALFLRAQQVVPHKGRSVTLLECARLEEFVGNVEIARALLSRSRFAATSDWKIWLESVLLEVRSGHPLRAIDLARRALVNHSGTGRLWACLVQLRHFDGGEEAQFSSLRHALMAVPKSGEVWCEGGRIHLNPFSNTFDLTEARRHLFFATRFTPQYGDSFLETVKLEILEQWIAPVALNLWQVMQPMLLQRLEDDSGDSDGIIAEMVQDAVRKVLESLSSGSTVVEDESDAGAKLRASLGRALTVDAAKAALDNSVLELRCSNAGPNYGLMWFHSRQGPTDTARTVIGRGRDMMVAEIVSYVHVYIGAMVRRFAIMTTLRHQNNVELPSVGGSKNTDVIDTDGLEELEVLLDARLRAAPSLENMLQPGEEIDGTVLLESSVNASHFVTGYVELNKFRPIKTLSLHARRRALFGSDALFS